MDIPLSVAFFKLLCTANYEDDCWLKGILSVDVGFGFCWEEAC